VIILLLNVILEIATKKEFVEHVIFLLSEQLKTHQVTETECTKNI